MVFPRHCIECNRWLVSHEVWQLGCSLCEQQWPDLRGEVGEKLMKERCDLDRMWTGFRLRDNVTLEHQIRALKYHGDRQLGLLWGRWVANVSKVPKPSMAPIGLVPVPLHWRRRWNRGFNQADWIAKGAAMEWNVPVYWRALFRPDHSRSHTGFSRKKRSDSSASAYQLGASPPPQGTKIILVDDVMTTGATLRACTSVLEAADCEVLGALTLALA
tara:strand:+ start:5231 stop:5878 length:648 start_codon:yes stop_codon:yes gene_type:complete